MSLEGRDGGEPLNVRRQVILRLWSCDKKGSQSKGSVNCTVNRIIPFELNADETSW